MPLLLLQLLHLSQSVFKPVTVSSSHHPPFRASLLLHPSPGESFHPLPASASLHHHVLIILQHHSVLRVQVEQGDGAEGGGDAAGPRHCSIHRVYKGLNHGVAGGVHVVSQGEATLSQAEESIVATWCNYPLVPAHIIEIYI